MKILSWSQQTSINQKLMEAHHFFCFSVIIQLVFLLLPGRQPLNYYLCSGIPNLIDLDSLPSKIYVPIFVTLTFSFFIYIGFKVMLTAYKIKAKNSVATIQKTRSGQSQCINLTLKTRQIADIASIFFGLLIFTFIIICFSLVNKISLSKVSEYPNYHIVHLANLICPTLGFGSICLLYYARNKPLRLAVTKELANFLNQFNFF